MAVTQADIDNLNAAIASERQVTIGNQSVTFNSTESLIKARDDMRAEYARAMREAAGTRIPRQTRLNHAAGGTDGGSRRQGGSRPWPGHDWRRTWPRSRRRESLV